MKTLFYVLWLITTVLDCLAGPRPWSFGLLVLAGYLPMVAPILVDALCE